jgi:ParB family chromosome partitioning protein
MSKHSNKSTLMDKMVVGAQAAAASVSSGSFADRLASVDSLQARAVEAAQSVGLGVKRLALDDILDREDGDLRPINTDHVHELADSIAAVGLLQFPVVDERNRLLAGGHRREALRLLRDLASSPDDEVRKVFERAEGDEKPERLTAEDIERYRTAFARRFSEGVLVNVFDILTHGGDPAAVRLEVEAIENEKRLDFTKGELATIVERLKQAGYREIGGKPKPGQRMLSKELGRIIGKSRRSVFRILSELRDPEAAAGKPSVSDAMKELAKEISEKLGTRVTFHAGDGQAGKIVIRYSNYKQRGELLKELRLTK